MDANLIHSAKELAHDLAAQLCTLWGSDADIQCTAIANSAIDKSGNLLNWTQRIDKSDGQVWIAAPASSWQLVARFILQREEGDALDEDLARETYSDSLHQGVRRFAKRLSERLSISLEAGTGAEEELRNPGYVFLAETKVNDQSCKFYVGFTEPVINLCLTGDEPAAAALSAESKRNANSAVDLLLDVELPVCVSFGKSVLRLRDVLKLATGSLIELNRDIDSHVDVIVNNCVIARGEVVVIQGNYGVRIHEVISRNDRALLQHFSRTANQPTSAA